MSTAFAPADTRRVNTSLPQEYLDSPSPQPLATFLGLFSVGLGLWELLSPRTVSDATGVRYPGLLRAYGLRELAAGVGILTNDRPAGWLWARVAGDVVDLATLGAAYAQAPSGSRDRTRALLAAGAVAGVTALDVIAAQTHSATD